MSTSNSVESVGTIIRTPSGVMMPIRVENDAASWDWIGGKPKSTEIGKEPFTILARELREEVGPTVADWLLIRLSGLTPATLTNPRDGRHIIYYPLCVTAVEADALEKLWEATRCEMRERKELQVVPTRVFTDNVYGAVPLRNFLKHLSKHGAVRAHLGLDE